MSDRIDGEDEPARTECFFITPLGEDDSPVRRRADEIQFIIDEVLSEFGLSSLRADKIGTPGMITHQIVNGILTSPMVFADLTGANANVYYEVGVAHSFGRPLVAMIDRARDLTFDTAHDRAIIIGDDGVLSNAQARQLKDSLAGFVGTVVSGSYHPRNVVTDASNTVAIDDMRPTDPVMTVLNQVFDEMMSLRSRLDRASATASQQTTSDLALTRRLVEYLMTRTDLPQSALRDSLIDGQSSAEHEAWVDRLMLSTNESGAV